MHEFSCKGCKRDTNYAVYYDNRLWCKSCFLKKKEAFQTANPNKDFPMVLIYKN